jgi:hypothetical protein
MRRPTDWRSSRRTPTSCSRPRRSAHPREAAKALLSLDFGKYGNPYWAMIDDDSCLNKTFLLQVCDVDQSFRVNYCEYVLAQRLDPTEPGAAPDRGRR